MKMTLAGVSVRWGRHVTPDTNGRSAVASRSRASNSALLPTFSQRRSRGCPPVQWRAACYTFITQKRSCLNNGNLGLTFPANYFFMGFIPFFCHIWMKTLGKRRKGLEGQTLVRCKELHSRRRSQCMVDCSHSAVIHITGKVLTGVNKDATLYYDPLTKHLEDFASFPLTGFIALFRSVSFIRSITWSWPH